MSVDRGKPVHLTQGECRLVIEACEQAAIDWERRRGLSADSQHEQLCKLRCRQYRRIIRECRLADPEPKPG